MSFIFLLVTMKNDFVLQVSTLNICLSGQRVPSFYLNKV